MKAPQTLKQNADEPEMKPALWVDLVSLSDLQTKLILPRWLEGNIQIMPFKEQPALAQTARNIRVRQGQYHYLQARKSGITSVYKLHWERD